MIKEITARELDVEAFVNEQTKEIRDIVGDGTAINALSGGVDSSTVTMLGYHALGDRLKTIFVDNGIMREGEPGQVARVFANLGVHVEVIDARAEFFSALKGITDPEEKREAITQTFTETCLGASSRKVTRNAASGNDTDRRR